MRDFTSGRIGRQIILFSLPIIAGNFLMQLYQIVDCAIVGQYLGKQALAAVGASMPVVFTTIALIIGIGSGASVVISQYFGAKQNENIRLTSDTLHIFLLVSGVAIAVLGYFFSDDIFRMISLPPEVVPQATTYLQIYLAGMVLLFGFNTISSILRGVGDSVTPLYFLALSAVLNVGLDLLFILVFQWGVAGAAWATVVSQGAAYFAAIWYINRKNSVFKIHLLKLKFNWRIFRQCVNYGIPTGIQQSFVALGGLALMAIINEYGTDVIAGYTAGMRVEALAVIPAMNFSMALTSFVGQNIGAGRIDRVKKGLRLTLWFSSVTCVVITALIIVFGERILGLFSDDVAVIDVGVEYMVICSSFYLFFNAMFVINGMLRGAGAVIFPMFSTVMSLWAIRIPVALLLSREMGQTGIWWSIPIGWAAGLLMVVIYYRTGKWKNNSIFHKQQNTKS